MDQEKFIQLIKGKWLQKKTFQKCNFVAIDSRSEIFYLHPPEEIVFFCFEGLIYSGQTFIPFLYQEKGVRCFIVSDKHFVAELYPQANFIWVEDTKKALQDLAEYFRSTWNFPVLALTGSYGKTMVKEWLVQILTPILKIVKNPKSYNSQIGLPLSVLACNHTNYDLGVFETGISHPCEMDILQTILQPNYVVFTGISEQEHSENFNNLQHKIEEKINLAKNAKVLFYSKKNDDFTFLIQKKYPNPIHFTWGKSSDCNLQILELQPEHEGTKIYFLNQKKEKLSVWVPFQEVWALENVLAVLAVVLFLDRFSECNFYFSELSTENLRLNYSEAEQKSILMYDSYNLFAENWLFNLGPFLANQEYTKKTLIFTDFLTQINEKEKIYQQFACDLKSLPVEKFIFIGSDFLTYQNYFSELKRVFFFASILDFLTKINQFNFNQQAIFIQGQQKLEPEKIAQQLQKKQHSTWIEINMNALEQNLRYFRGIVPKNTGLMAMVKARAYGSSETETAQFLAQKGVDYFGVAFENEGIELRKNQIKKPILVMYANPEYWARQKKYQLEPVISSFLNLEKYFFYLQQQPLSEPFPIHLEIDTGMHRLGFTVTEIPKLLQFFEEKKQIFQVKSIYSHLAAADEPGLDHFTHQQIEQFENVKKSLKLFFPEALFHILNSAGTQRFPQAAMDLVRLGIGLYGIGTAGHQSALHSVIRCKTRIIHLQELDKTETVSYGRSGKLQQKTLVGTIPIGYADGLRRKLGNGVWSVFAGEEKNGKLCPIIGNVCMDFSMIDLSGIDAKVGDEVTIFGSDTTSILKMAEILETIPYEILTNLAPRIPRFFVKE